MGNFKDWIEKKIKLLNLIFIHNYKSTVYLHIPKYLHTCYKSGVAMKKKYSIELTFILQ